MDVGAEVRDEYFVVGVELNGEARVYPLNRCRGRTTMCLMTFLAVSRSPSRGAGFVSASRILQTG